MRTRSAERIAPTDGDPWETVEADFDAAEAF